MRKEKLFGTDGIRGKANSFPLIEEIVEKIGFSSGKILGKEKGKVLIGYDTRKSCYEIKKWLFSGLKKSAMTVFDCGVFPTPGISAMVREKNFDFGIVISASHNPYSDNGIKFFSQSGEKLSEEKENEIESLIFDLKDLQHEKTKGEIIEIDLEEDYLKYILGNFPDLNLEKKRILLDTANGASYKVGPKLFSRLNANVKVINNFPTGENINKECGSLFAEKIKKEIEMFDCEVGFSFDGDADRCLAVIPSGKILDGDYLLYNEAVSRKRKGILKNNIVVGTIMSNYGVEKALQKQGISFFRTKVGDKYVYEALKEKDGELGGEPSGHIIFLDKSLTGDGLITALSFCQNGIEKGGIERLFDGVTMCFQKIVNLKVAKKIPIEEIDNFQMIVDSAECIVGGEGRIVLRYSGTEPLLRIMVEAEKEEKVNKTINYLTEKLNNALSKEE